MAESNSFSGKDEGTDYDGYTVLYKYNGSKLEAYIPKDDDVWEFFDYNEQNEQMLILMKQMSSEDLVSLFNASAQASKQAITNKNWSDVVEYAILEAQMKQKQQMEQYMVSSTITILVTGIVWNLYNLALKYSYITIDADDYIDELIVAEGTKQAVQLGDEIGNLGTLVENPNITPDWSLAKLHMFNRMDQKGVTVEMFESWVKNGAAIQQDVNTILYLHKDGVAVMSMSGRPITTYGADSFRTHILDAIELVFGK